MKNIAKKNIGIAQENLKTKSSDGINVNILQ